MTWTKETRVAARAELEEAFPSLDGYVSFDSFGDNSVCLDGHFTIPELRKIIKIMEKYSQPQSS